MSLIFIPYTSRWAKIAQGHRLISIEELRDGGFLGLLQGKNKNNIYGPDIPLLQLFVKHETEDRLRVHITDAQKQRWEVPYNLLPREKPPVSMQAVRGLPKSPIEASDISGSEFIFSYKADLFGFAVKRKSNGQTLSNSNASGSNPFRQIVFKDQYPEISKDQYPLQRSAHLIGSVAKVPPNIKRSNEN